MDSTSYSTAVAGNVRTTLKAAGLSVTELAAVTGISRQTLARRLAPINPSPLTMSELKSIADALGTTALQLATVVIATERAVA